MIDRDAAEEETYLTVEDVLRSRLLVLHIPHQGHAVRLVGGILVVVIGGDQQLRILVTGEEELAEPELKGPKLLIAIVF